MVGETCDRFDETGSNNLEPVTQIEAHGFVPGVGPDQIRSVDPSMTKAILEEESAESEVLQAAPCGHSTKLHRRALRFVDEWAVHPRADGNNFVGRVDDRKVERIGIVVSLEVDGRIGHPDSQDLSSQRADVGGTHEPDVCGSTFHQETGRYPR